MTSNPERTDLTTLVEQAVAAYNDQDWERYERFFVEDLYFCHHNRGLEYRTRKDLFDNLRIYTPKYPDRRLGPAAYLVQDQNVVVRAQTWSGTALADAPGLATKGEQFAIDLCTVMVFDGDRISEYHDYG